jgi:hypothetical protein
MPILVRSRQRCASGAKIAPLLDEWFRWRLRAIVWKEQGLPAAPQSDVARDRHGSEWPACVLVDVTGTTAERHHSSVIDRLRQRFAIGRACVVADRSMINTAAIAGLEERKLKYIPGVRERGSREVSGFVLNIAKPFVPLHIPRDRRNTE